MKSVCRISGDLIIEVYVCNVEGKMFLGVPAERFLKFLLAHLRKDYILDANRMSAHAGRNSRGPNLMLVEDAGNYVCDVVELHDLTVYNRIWLKILESHIHQLK